MPHQLQEQREGHAPPARVVVTTAELRNLLDEAFRQGRSRPCPFCHVPLPYYWEPGDNQSENWRIGAPWKCSHGCHLVITEAALQLAKLYDVKVPRAERVALR